MTIKNIIVRTTFCAVFVATAASAQDQKAPASVSHFTGKTSVKMHTDAKNGLDCSVGSVSFEPGARTNWHSHAGGQILLIEEGTAYYQEKVKPKRILHKGDLVTCLPNTEHWHGASPDSRMTHIAIGPNADKGPVVWLGKVGDEEYLKGTTISASKEFLSKRQQSIVAISAMTAKGDLALLKTELNKGLDAGLSINENKEILIQLYAYCGFPRSLNAINTLKTVTEERKAAGKTDPVGTEPTLIAPGVNKYDLGKKNLENLTGQAETGKAGYALFVPVIEIFLKEHLFADIFSRGVLSNQDRELVTVAALTSLGGVEAQLQGHLAIGRKTGLSDDQLKQMHDLVSNL